MEGRWTIHWKGDPSHLGERLTAWMSGPGVHADDGPVPVVPCDDAAIERARASGFDAAQVALNAQGGHLAPEDRALFDTAIEAAFRAAGETP